jgi:hypothetical protein
VKVFGAEAVGQALPQGRKVEFISRVGQGFSVAIIKNAKQQPRVKCRMVFGLVGTNQISTKSRGDWDFERK